MMIRRRTDVEPGGHLMTTQKLGSGWAAVEMWRNAEDLKPDIFWEPWQTGMGRYETRQEALIEAQAWCIADDIAMDFSEVTTP